LQPIGQHLASRRFYVTDEGEIYKTNLKANAKGWQLL
jgi:hypothetical protein